MYDIWKDDNGNIHILPQGMYRLIHHKSSTILITWDGVQYLVSTGAMMCGALTIQQALGKLKKINAGEEI